LICDSFFPSSLSSNQASNKLYIHLIKTTANPNKDSTLSHRLAILWLHLLMKMTMGCRTSAHQIWNDTNLKMDPGLHRRVSSIVKITLI
jgi:hypothetical protein